MPGIGIAAVTNDRLLFSRAFGHCDLSRTRPVSTSLKYPIASTAKAMNAALIGMLVDDRLLDWDAPVAAYLPDFTPNPDALPTEVTLRDLIAMRTGLPRHDWAWLGMPLNRSELARRIQHLSVSCGFRERFQYCNLSVTLAGHVAEVVTGQAWEELIQSRLLEPLGMRRTTTRQPNGKDHIVGFCADKGGAHTPSIMLASGVTAPSGGALYSTLDDMARWAAFNLAGGRWAGVQLIKPETMRVLQAGMVPTSGDVSAPSLKASYAMGWFVDKYRAAPRLTHGGFLHNVGSEVTLFPEQNLGIVSFVNLGISGIARAINQRAYEEILGIGITEDFGLALARHHDGLMSTAKAAIASLAAANSALGPAGPFCGLYRNEGYGDVTIYQVAGGLRFLRGEIDLPLEHLHPHRCLVGKLADFTNHAAFPFDGSHFLTFRTAEAGEVEDLSMDLEPSVAPIRFSKVATVGQGTSIGSFDEA